MMRRTATCLITIAAVLGGAVAALAQTPEVIPAPSNGPRLDAPRVTTPPSAEPRTTAPRIRLPRLVAPRNATPSRLAPPVVPAKSLLTPPVVGPVYPVAPVAVAPVAACCQPRIVYRNHPLKRRKHLKHQPQCELVLSVPTPGGCCQVPVKVCVPACCVGVPRMDCHRGFLGRHVVEFCWDCGYRVKMVFTKHSDTLIVHYLGA